MFVCLFVAQLGINICENFSIENWCYNGIIYYFQQIYSIHHRHSTRWQLRTTITMIFPNVLRRLMPYAYTLITENRDGFITYIIERFISNFNIIPTSCLHSLNPRLRKLCNPVYDKKKIHENTKIDVLFTAKQSQFKGMFMAANGKV